MISMPGMNRNYNYHNAAGIMNKINMGKNMQGESTNKFSQEKVSEDYRFAAALTKETDQQYDKICVKDSIAIIKNQMGEDDDYSFIHNSVSVIIDRDSLYGDVITIGGTDNPDWITVNTSVGSVKIDMNDLQSVGKCMDLFSPDDQKKIMEGITKNKMAQRSEQEIDEEEEKFLDKIE